MSGVFFRKQVEDLRFPAKRLASLGWATAPAATIRRRSDAQGERIQLVTMIAYHYSTPSDEARGQSSSPTDHDEHIFRATSPNCGHWAPSMSRRIPHEAL